MSSMNWLGFSLSPQELPPSSNPHHHHHSRLAYNSDEISGNDVSGECFDLTSDHSTAADHLPPPFGILEAFNRNNHHSQDWNMKGLGMNSSTETNDNYKTSSSSDLSMLMNNVSANHNQQNLDNNQHHHHHHQQQQQQPKLENFLGRHSFADHDHHHHYTTAAPTEYVFPASCTSLQIPSDSSNVAGENNSNNDNSGNGNRNSNNGSSIGLSMIKTWLRNQPESRTDHVGGATAAPAVSSSTAAQSALSLSMSTGSQSSNALPLLTSAAASGGDSSSSDNNKQHHQAAAAAAAVDGQSVAVEAVPRKSIDTFGQRTSIYRGVTRHRWTGRYEAHLWDNSCRREGQTRKGRQVYLGGYDKEEKAARAYDLAALKYWGTTTTTNFPITNYEKELEEMKHMTRQEYVASLRRKSSGFSRGASIYRGVTRHHQHGRWQARIGRVAGNKDLYLGTFSTQEEAAEAYDIAAIKFRGLNAVTNFDMSRYDVKSILESSTLPIGGAAKRLKDAEAAQAEITIAGSAATADDSMSSHLTDAISTAYAAAAAGGWPALAYGQPAVGPPSAFAMHYPSYAGAGTRVWCKQEVQDQPDHHHHHHHHGQSFPYHDLQMNNTHNFFQPNSVLHNLMGIDHHNSSSTIEHSSGSNSVMYSADSSNNNNGGGYVIPMTTTVIANDQQGSAAFSTAADHDHIFGASSTTTDMSAYHRSLYNYMSQQPQLGGVVKASGSGGGSYDNWVPTAVPTIAAAAPRSNTMAVCHATPTFTVWNDA